MVQIALATDANYFQPTIVAMLSAIESTRALVRVHFIDFGLGEQGRQIVARAVGLHGHADLVYHEGTAEMQVGAKQDSYITPVAMARLHLPKLAQGKVLWLDSDVLVHGDIGELFDIDIGDALIAAVRDFGALNGMSKPEQKVGLLNHMNQAVGPLPYQNYINSGVVLFNGDAMAAEPGFVEALASQVRQERDQPTINYHCRGRVAFLNPSWNVMAGLHHKYAGIQEAHLPPQEHFAASPANITHYVSLLKPWHEFDLDAIASIGVDKAPTLDHENGRAEFAIQVLAYRKAEARMLAMLQE